MRREQIVSYCLSKPGAVETWPFGDGVAVLKVAGKLFALCPVDADPPEVSLKCDPTLATALRSTYRAVRPGYHLNKRHWNTVTLDGSVDDDEVEEWIDHSYELVVAKLPRTERAALCPEGTPDPVRPRSTGAP
jgi:predicted DNA-binding protein (MmcQ/YjbR family)